MLYDNRRKLTETDVRAILQDPRRQVEIAKAYGVTPPTIGSIKRRNTWRHIEPRGELSVHHQGSQGEEHPKAKLTDDQARAIRKDPRTLREIAAEYGVSLMTVSYIRRGITWRHLT